MPIATRDPYGCHEPGRAPVNLIARNAAGLVVAKSPPSTRPMSPEAVSPRDPNLGMRHLRRRTRFSQVVVRNESAISNRKSPIVSFCRLSLVALSDSALAFRRLASTIWLGSEATVLYEIMNKAHGCGAVEMTKGVAELRAIREQRDMGTQSVLGVGRLLDSARHCCSSI